MIDKNELIEKDLIDEINELNNGIKKNLLENKNELNNNRYYNNKSKTLTSQIPIAPTVTEIRGFRKTNSEYSSEYDLEQHRIKILDEAYNIPLEQLKRKDSSNEFKPNPDIVQRLSTSIQQQQNTTTKYNNI